MSIVNIKSKSFFLSLYIGLKYIIRLFWNQSVKFYSQFSYTVF